MNVDLQFESVDPFLHNPDEALEHFEATLRGGIRLVAVSAVQFQTGLRMPLGELARLLPPIRH